MFSGITEGFGKIIDYTDKSIKIKSDVRIINGLLVSDSIAINGVCLTVVKIDHENSSFVVNISHETREKTNLDLVHQSIVNIEQSKKLGERLHGHIVQGHIDGMGELKSIEKKEDFFDFEFLVPNEILSYIIEKGSVTVNGVSLTVNEYSSAGFKVTVIPYTFSETNFKFLTVGNKVNIEVDIIGKYVKHFLNNNVGK